MATLPRITVVGLGPAGPDLLTAGTLAAIAAVPVRFVRTDRHPSVSAVGDATSFDHHYENAGAIADVYDAIVEDLVVAAGRWGRVLYAVPGSPAVAEHTVEILRTDPRVTVDVVPALSCVDLAWVRLGVDPLASGVRVVDGHRFAQEAAGERGPLLVLQCDHPAVLASVKLALDDGAPVTVLQRLGLPDESIVEVPWHEVDRVAPDHLTSLWISELAVPVGRELIAFEELVRTLRAECPWDREQTHESLRRYLIEEAYEVLDAIDGLAANGYEHLEEELGDLLFQVYFHATLAAEEGQFTLADVARGIHDKLVRRHPAVFGQPDGAGWEAQKRLEKARSSALDGVPGALPSLALADTLQRKAAAVGFDWAEVEGAWAKVDEECAELREAAAAGDADAVAGEFGDLLFACVNVGRHLGVDPETALRRAAQKFGERFRAVEALAAAQGLAMPGTDVAVLDGLWDEVKRTGR